MDLPIQPPEPLPEAPPALVQKAVHMETGIELSTYNWLLQLAQAIQDELDAYEKGDEDEQNRAIFHQRRLINSKGMPPLSEEDIQAFIARIPSKTIADIMTTMCQDKKAIEEARARYEKEIVEILKTDGHIIDQLLLWTNRRFYRATNT